MSQKVVIGSVFDRYKRPRTSFVHELAQMLPKDRYETVCIYLDKSCDEPNPVEEHCRCFYLDGVPNGPLKWLRLAKLLKREQIAIIHANRHAATFQSTIAAFLAGTPVVISHVHGMNRCRNIKRKFFYWLFSSKITRMIGISEGVLDDIRKEFPGMKNKGVHIPNSIIYEKFAQNPQTRNKIRKEFSIPLEDFVFVCVGRLVPTKGHDLLLDAFASLGDNGKNVKLLIVGTGRLEESIKQKIRSLRIEQKVIMAGFRKDIPDILHASDGFVLTSVREGFGLVVAEAMAAGLPVIATGDGGVREVIDDAGIYLENRDPTSLADAMKAIIKLSESERVQLVNRASQRVESSYNHSVALGKLITLYESCLREKAKSTLP